jgi:hypothetical protein
MRRADVGVECREKEYERKYGVSLYGVSSFEKQVQGC